MTGEEFAVGKWAVEQLLGLWRWIRGGQRKGPKKPLRLVFQPRARWWGWASVGGEPAMQAHAEWSVANLTDEAVKVVRAFETRTKTEAHADTEDRECRCWGRYPIPPHGETDLSVHFVACPLPRGVRDGVDHRCTVVLIDQFGNRYKERVSLRGRKRHKPERPDPGEAIHGIADPVKKQVASVLKDEVARYRDCGRRVGGLGSIQTTHKGRALRGVGSDWRTPDVPTNQAIAEDAGGVSVTSDNAAGLVTYFNQLDEEARQRFLTALTARMSKDTEYAPVGYFGLLVLHRIGDLKLALETAKAQLQDDGAYGFSDFLRLLDGMLRYEHRSFSDADLDDIESFVRGVEEHTFRILERVTAIRAFRVRTAGSQSVSE